MKIRKAYQGKGFEPETLYCFNEMLYGGACDACTDKEECHKTRILLRNIGKQLKELSEKWRIKLKEHKQKLIEKHSEK